MEKFIEYHWWHLILVALVLVIPTMYYHIRAIYFSHYSVDEDKYDQAVEVLNASLLRKKPEGLEQWALVVWSVLVSPVLIAALPFIFLWPFMLIYTIVM